MRTKEDVRKVEEDLRKLVDSTGFAFQFAVEESVKGTPFSVVATEHAYVHPRTGAKGFADAILSDEAVRFVVESKRVRDGNWIFLQPQDRKSLSAARSQRAEVFWTAVSARGRGVQTDTGEPIDRGTGVDAFDCNPTSPQCPFCIVRGASDDQQSMLERLAGRLLEATEAIADEQMQLDLANRPVLRAEFWFYVPVIVTNATLWVCSFAPAKVDGDGMLPHDAKFERAPVVRFFKNLSWESGDTSQQDLAGANRAKNRTVFVVESQHFPTFLNTFKSGDRLPPRLMQFLT